MCCRKERGHLPACRGTAEYADESLRTGKTTGTAGGNTYCWWIGRYAKWLYGYVTGDYCNAGWCQVSLAGSTDW